MLGDFEKSALRKFLDFNCGNVWRFRSEKVQKVILCAKNSVWRRLRRAKQDFILWYGQNQIKNTVPIPAARNDRSTNCV